MMLYASSCERPSKSSTSVFLPSSVSNSYSFSTGTQGSSSRFFLISSLSCACSASRLASSSRAACHSSRVPILCSGIFFPPLHLGRSRRERVHVGLDVNPTKNYDSPQAANSSRQAGLPSSSETRVDSIVDRRRRPVFLVGDVVAPGRRVAFVIHLEHREVGHEARRCGAVPMLLAGLEEDGVAGVDHLDRAAAPLCEGDALEDVNRLSVRVRVPRGACAGCEVDAAG